MEIKSFINNGAVRCSLKSIILTDKQFSYELILDTLQLTKQATSSSNFWFLAKYLIPFLHKMDHRTCILKCVNSRVIVLGFCLGECPTTL